MVALDRKVLVSVHHYSFYVCRLIMQFMQQRGRTLYSFVLCVLTMLLGLIWKHVMVILSANSSSQTICKCKIPRDQLCIYTFFYNIIVNMLILVFYSKINTFITTLYVKLYAISRLHFCLTEGVFLKFFLSIYMCTLKTFHII